ncbi:ATP-binding protein [Pseudonocardia charpentierae]|uniref:ATP-binding protein n=1 Tax=Pseudonocardia charpentierae TaxID=3075545 RepID=A0ABU2NB77_9PSEU|nr:ATP-binding protein [Pseudonocardia sp. DSM 45834]MDT0350273.1 ATP-binding protein [Pseudonocardia sp. DSM 45834]
MGDLLPALDRLALATAHLPGRSDGDESGTVIWYEVAAGADGSVAVALGAVRDADAATQMRRRLAGLDPAHRSPAATLGCLDQAARAMPALVGSAALCLTLDPDGVLRWIAAGHAPPLVAGPDGARYLDGGQVEPLGHAGRTPAAEAEESLAAGTTVVLCSSAEQTLGVPTGGDDPVVAALVPRHGLPPAALAQALTEHAGNRSRDRRERTLFLARVMPAPLEQRLPADPRRLSAVRRAVAAWSAQAALSEDAAADLQLLLSEAITNAVEHAYCESEAGEFVYSVRRRHDAGVRVVVQDFGRWRPPPEDPGYRGRGLAVIHNLAEDVSLDFSDHGTQIAFTVPNDLPPLGERPLKGVTQGWAPDR